MLKHGTGACRAGRMRCPRTLRTNRTVRIIDILTPKSVLDEKPKSQVTVRVLPNLRGSSLHLAKLLNALEIREPESRSRL
jgi:hypothetical protein